MAPRHGAFAPIVLGAAAAAAGVGAGGAALACAHGAVATPASAAVRLLALDPFAVVAVQAALAADIDAVAVGAADYAAAIGRCWSALPAVSAPLLDVGAGRHAAWEVRLFAS